MHHTRKTRNRKITLRSCRRKQFHIFFLKFCFLEALFYRFCRHSGSRFGGILFFIQSVIALNNSVLLQHSCFGTRRFSGNQTQIILNFVIGNRISRKIFSNCGDINILKLHQFLFLGKDVLKIWSRKGSIKPKFPLLHL